MRIPYSITIFGFLGSISSIVSLFISINTELGWFKTTIIIFPFMYIIYYLGRATIFKSPIICKNTRLELNFSDHKKVNCYKTQKIIPIAPHITRLDEYIETDGIIEILSADIGDIKSNLKNLSGESKSHQKYQHEFYTELKAFGIYEKKIEFNLINSFNDEHEHYEVHIRYPSIIHTVLLKFDSKKCPKKVNCIVREGSISLNRKKLESSTSSDGLITFEWTLIMPKIGRIIRLEWKW